MIWEMPEGWRRERYAIGVASSVARNAAGKLTTTESFTAPSIPCASNPPEPFTSQNRIVMNPQGKRSKGARKGHLAAQHATTAIEVDQHAVGHGKETVSRMRVCRGAGRRGLLCGEKDGPQVGVLQLVLAQRLRGTD